MKKKHKTYKIASAYSSNSQKPKMNKKAKHPLFVSLLVFFILIFSIASYFVMAGSFNPEDTREIGYEYLDSNGLIVDELEAEVIHIWNAKDNYFFDKSSGIQFTNHFQDYWTHNIFCGGYKDASNDWVYRCNDELPFNWNINTDDETYINYTGWRDITVGDKEVRAAVRYHLKTTDKNLTIQFSIENIGDSNINTDIGFAWKSNNIQINGQEDDFIEIDGTTYLLNETLDETYTNLDTAIYRLFDKTGTDLWLKWNENLNYMFKVKSEIGQYNAPIILGINAGTLDVGQEKHTEMFWHDADYWTYNVTIFDVGDSTDPGDDTYVGDCEITVEEGSTGTYCGGANLVNLIEGKTYFLRIKGNTTEVSYIYDADAAGETYLSYDNRTYYTVKGRTGDLNYIPSDDSTGEGYHQVCNAESYGYSSGDIMFWSTIFNDSINESVADSINYSVDANILEGYSCYIDWVGNTCEEIDFKGSESASGDTDTENGGFTGWDSQDMTTGEFYYWGVIFEVDSDWSNGDKTNWLFHQEGEGGDSDQEILWNWTMYEAPTVSIDYPENDSWLNNNESISLNFTYTNGTALDTCLFTTNNYTTNTTITNCINTTFNRTEGNYLLEIWINDSNGISAEDETNFTIDITTPQISYEPETEADYTNKSQSFIYVNVTWTEINLANITFSLYNDTATINSTNFTTATYDINWTGLSDDNNYTYEVNITDMANNKNYTALRHITLDNIEPYVLIDHPKPQSYSTNESLSLNYTINDAISGVDSCWFKVINSTSDLIIDNKTIAGCVNTTFNVSQGEGTYNLTLYSNDTTNNLNSSEVEFGISVTGPAIVLDDPSDNSYLDNRTNIYFNFTATDTDGLDTCSLWGNWTGAWHKNYTWVGPTSGTQNYTTLNITEGTFIWNAFCNDTSDNSNWALNNFTLTVDETNPNATITTANNTIVDSLSITINYNISDTHLEECYFTLRTSGGLLHNYPENTSLTCSSTSRSISTTYYGTFVLQIWGEDYAGNLGDANLTFTTLTSGDPGGGGGAAEPEIITVYENKTFCGDLICQSEGNDFGIKENYWNCQQDCPGAIGENLDILVASLTSYCWDRDPSTVCFFATLFAAVPGMGPPEALENITFYRNGELCIGEVCERISMKTLFSNCISGEGPCFFSSNFGVLSLFGFGAVLLGISFLRVPAPYKTGKVNPYQYVGIRLKKRSKRRKWRR